MVVGACPYLDKRGDIDCAGDMDGEVAEMKKPEEMTVSQYNDLMMKDAEEMLKKALYCVRESEARLKIADDALYAAMKTLEGAKKC